MLTALILIPLVGALFVLVAPGKDDTAPRVYAIAAATLTLVFAVVMALRFDETVPGYQFVQDIPWIESLGASWHLGVDGVAVTLVLLTALLTPLVIATSGSVTENVRGYLAAMLALETTVLGVFLSLDLLVFYVFFEFSLVPMYFIIALWGGKNRRMAATKFFLFTLAGGLALLAAIVYIAATTGTFDYIEIARLYAGQPLASDVQTWLFWGFFAAFAIKLPMVGVHTWLPDAHTEAPTGGSVMLAGVLLKMGGFGLLRYNLPLFGDAAQAAAPIVVTLGVIGIIWGAAAALAQTDIKKLIAYSSVSHMGFVLIGIFALNITGTSAAAVQMVNHGLSTGALFLLIGFLYDRRHTRKIADFGGLGSVTPRLTALFLVTAMSSLALPGLNGFVGEFPILLGTFRRFPVHAAIAAFGAVLAALYLLWTHQRVFHGPVNGEDNANTRDLSWTEVAVMVPLITLIVAIGLYPAPLYDMVNPAVERSLEFAGADDVVLHSTLEAQAADGHDHDGLPADDHGDAK